MTNSTETLSHTLTPEEIIVQATKQESDNLKASVDGIDESLTRVPVEERTAKDLKKKLNLNDSEVELSKMQYQNEKGKECYRIPITKTVKGPDNTDYTFQSTVYITKKDGKYQYTDTYQHKYTLTNPAGETPRSALNGKLVINNLVFNIPKNNTEISGFNIEWSPIDTEISYKNNIAESKYAINFETGTETENIKNLKEQQAENIYYEGENSDENKPENSIYKGLDQTAKTIVENAISLSKNIEETSTEGKKSYKREIFVEGKPTGKFVEYQTTPTGKINTIVPQLDEITIQGFKFKNQKAEQNNVVNTIDMQFKAEDMEAFKLHYIKQKNMILESTIDSGSEITKDFVMNKGGSPLDVVNPNKIEHNVLNVNGIKIPFIMENIEQGEQLKLVDLYGQPVTSMTIPGDGKYTKISLNEEGTLETREYANGQEQKKYEYLSINLNNNSQTLVGNINGDVINFYNPTTKKSIMTCPITFDEKTGYRFNPEGMNSVEVQSSLFYNQLDQTIDASSSTVKGISKESYHALLDYLFQERQDEIEKAIQEKNGIVCNGEYCILSTSDNIHLNLTTEKLAPITEIINNTILPLHQQIQTLEQRKIVNEKGEDIKNINAGATNTMISYSIEDLIAVYNGEKPLSINIDGKTQGINLMYVDGKKGNKEFQLQNTETDYVETQNGRRKVKMDKNQIKLELTQED